MNIKLKEKKEDAHEDMKYNSESHNKQLWKSALMIDNTLRTVMARLDEKGIKYNFFQDEIFIDPKTLEEMMTTTSILEEVFE